MGRAIGYMIGALLAATTPVRGEDDPCVGAAALKVSVPTTGVYRIPGAALREAFACDSLTPDRLQLSNRGEAVGAATLDGDLVFFGRHLAGEHSYYDEFSHYNTYWLATRKPDPAQVPPPTAQDRSAPPIPLYSSTRIEQDLLRVRFAPRPDGPPVEVWYWHRLNSIDPKPFAHDLDLPARVGSVKIRIALRGWSTLPSRKFPDVPDHRVEVFLNDHAIASAEWEGQDEHVIEIDKVADGVLRPSRINRLTLRVPERKFGDEQLPVVDAVLLNFIEVEYRHRGTVEAGQAHFRADHRADGWFRLSGPDKSPPLVMSERGRLVPPFASSLRGKRWWHRYRTLDGESDYRVVVGDGFYQPATIAVDRPSNLRDPAQQADYLMIGHRRLLEAVEPLAEFHRARGLTVRVVDVEDVYDEFNHGVLAPAAMRDFIAYAYHQWRRPAPRFVLLVGDASWDVHNVEGSDRDYADWTFRSNEKRRFLKNSSHPYDDGLHAADRNLIPTWPVDTYQGYAASDNVFVAVDGDDFLPDLAIGRFPVSEPDDVAAIVAKTIAYHEQAAVGPWRRKVLWITNEQAGLQRTSDQLDQMLSQNGFAGTKVYPSPEEKDNAQHQVALQQAFDEGYLLAHFIGHGGRYIWRTGPPDIHKNHDLFTLDHLEQLSPNPRLPFVLSMTCYSAPFDHPTADSIGEKFLRLPERGAIGILAASWRNSPTRRFSESMLTELIRPGTIGEAIMRAKQVEPANRLMVETYNLLGDPATRLALPSHELRLETKRRGGRLEVRGRVVDARFGGQAVIDWQEASGAVVRSDEVQLRRGGFRLSVDPEPVRAAGAIRVYAWDEERNLDAIGSLTLADQTVTAGGEPRPARASVASPVGPGDH